MTKGAVFDSIVDAEDSGTDTTNFDGNLSAADDTVQKALDTLDDLAAGGMVYPGAGIALSTGSAWDTSIANNSADWNTAFGWGDHATAGYLTSVTNSDGTLTISPTTGDVVASLNLGNANIWTAEQTFSDTINATHVPLTSANNQACLRVNPTSSAPNGRLLSLELSSNDRFYIDEDGDLFQVTGIVASLVGGTFTVTSGVPPTIVAGGNMKIGAGFTGVNYSLTFDGETNNGLITWMEDEDYFQFSDDLFLLAGEKLTIGDSATIPPLNITERSAAPSSPTTGDIYLDDGTNTASTTPGWRRYTGAVWEDVSAGTSGSLDGLSDVDTTGVNSGDFIQFDGANWVDFDLFDTANSWGAVQQINDAVDLRFGTTSGALFQWQTSGNDHLRIATLCGSATGAGIISIINNADTGSYSLANTAANPTLRLYATGAASTDYLEVYHDATDAIINAGSGSILRLKPDTICEGNLTIGGGAAGVDPLLTFNGEDSDGFIQWDEDGDRFIINDTIFMLSSTQIFFGGTSEYINSSSANKLTIAGGTDIEFKIGSSPEMTLTANNLTFNNGITDTGLNWDANGELRFRVGASNYAYLSSTRFRSGELQAAGDLGGAASTIALTNTSAAASKSAPTIPNLPAAAGGKASTWIKFYVGGSPHWVMAFS